jgi:hypothetical protein
MVSLLTALTIQGNDVVVQIYQDKEDSHKYGYVICMPKERNFRPLVTCPPVYETEVVARNKGDECISEIRKIDLSPEREGLAALLGDEVITVVGKIVEVAKK